MAELPPEFKIGQIYNRIGIQKSESQPLAAAGVDLIWKHVGADGGTVGWRVNAHAPSDGSIYQSSEEALTALVEACIACNCSQYV